jgi:SAM-dependent methyltransferase
MGATSTFVSADGDGYNLQMGRWSRRLALPFLDFAGCAAGERVLDVGSGTGSLTTTLTERVPVEQVDGIDFSEVYTAYATRHHGGPRVSFQVGDACALPFEAESYDRTLSLLMLHFVPEPSRAIDEMCRVTRPGGVVAAAVWDAQGGVVINRIFFDTAAALRPSAEDARRGSFTRPLTGPGQLTHAWRAAGLEDVTDTTLTIRMEFESFADYWAPYAGKDGPYAAYVSALDEPDRDALVEALRRAYCAGQPDGPRSYAATSWAVRGVVAS